MNSEAVQTDTGDDRPPRGGTSSLAPERIQALAGRPKRFRALMERAERGGYRVMRDVAYTDTWLLLDAADGALIHPAASLEEIECWLNE